MLFNYIQLDCPPSIQCSSLFSAAPYFHLFTVFAVFNVPLYSPTRPSFAFFTMQSQTTPSQDDWYRYLRPLAPLLLHNLQNSYLVHSPEDNAPDFFSDATLVAALTPFHDAIVSHLIFIPKSVLTRPSPD
jgi:hypothetical protein